MRPILKYPGAKWRLAPWIIEHMPPHIGYLEPFFGSGAVFFNKPSAHAETINDLDGAVVRFFRTCRDRPEELAYALSLTPWSREEFLLSGFDHDGDDVEAARRFAIRCWMTFGARTRTKTSWRHTTGGGDNPGPDNAKLWGRLPEIVRAVAERLASAQIENRPALDLLDLYTGPQLLIYLDPPYVESTRTLNGKQYRFEMTDAEHEALLRKIVQKDSMIMISGYECDMYNDYLSGWTLHRKDTLAERGAKRTECLWCNPLATGRLPNGSLFEPAERAERGG